MRLSIFCRLVGLAFLLGMLLGCSGGASLNVEWVQYGNNFDVTYYFNSQHLVDRVVFVHPNPFGGGDITSEYSVGNKMLQSRIDGGEIFVTVFEDETQSETFLTYRMGDGKVYWHDSGAWLQGLIKSGAFPVL